MCMLQGVTFAQVEATPICGLREIRVREADRAQHRARGACLTPSTTRREYARGSCFFVVIQLGSRSSDAPVQSYSRLSPVPAPQGFDIGASGRKLSNILECIAPLSRPVHHSCTTATRGPVLAESRADEPVQAAHTLGFGPNRPAGPLRGFQAYRSTCSQRASR